MPGMPASQTDGQTVGWTGGQTDRRVGWHPPKRCPPPHASVATSDVKSQSIVGPNRLAKPQHQPAPASHLVSYRTDRQPDRQTVPCFWDPKPLRGVPTRSLGTSETIPCTLPQMAARPLNNSCVKSVHATLKAQGYPCSTESACQCGLRQRIYQSPRLKSGRR
jgi:hypothetical protein